MIILNHIHLVKVFAIVIDMNLYIAAGVEMLVKDCIIVIKNVVYEELLMFHSEEKNEDDVMMMLIIYEG